MPPHVFVPLVPNSYRLWNIKAIWRRLGFLETSMTPIMLILTSLKSTISCANRVNQLSSSSNAQYFCPLGFGDKQRKQQFISKRSSNDLSSTMKWLAHFKDASAVSAMINDHDPPTSYTVQIIANALFCTLNNNCRSLLEYRFIAYWNSELDFGVVAIVSVISVPIFIFAVGQVGRRIVLKNKFSMMKEKEIGWNTAGGRRRRAETSSGRTTWYEFR